MNAVKWVLIDQTNGATTSGRLDVVDAKADLVLISGVGGPRRTSGRIVGSRIVIKCTSAPTR